MAGLVVPRRGFVTGVTEHTAVPILSNPWLSDQRALKALPRGLRDPVLEGRWLWVRPGP